jgi:hypothetical protein
MEKQEGWFGVGYCYDISGEKLTSIVQSHMEPDREGFKTVGTSEEAVTDSHATWDVWLNNFVLHGPNDAVTPDKFCKCLTKYNILGPVVQSYCLLLDHGKRSRSRTGCQKGEVSRGRGE